MKRSFVLLCAAILIATLAIPAEAGGPYRHHRGGGIRIPTPLAVLGGLSLLDVAIDGRLDWPGAVFNPHPQVVVAAPPTVVHPTVYASAPPAYYPEPYVERRPPPARDYRDRYEERVVGTECFEIVEHFDWQRDSFGHWYVANTWKENRRISHNHGGGYGCGDRYGRHDNWRSREPRGREESRVVGIECWEIFERYEWRTDDYGNAYTQKVGRDRRKIC